MQGLLQIPDVETPRVGPKLSLNQLEEKLLNEKEKQRYQAITGAVMCLAQCHSLRYPLRSQPAREGHVQACESSHGAAKRLFYYLAGSADFPITYKQGDFRLAAFSDANWGKDTDNGRSMLSYIALVTDASIRSNVRLQGLTAQSTIEAELVAATLTMEEAVFCPNMMLGLGLDESFGSVPIYIDNTSALPSQAAAPTVLAKVHRAEVFL